MFCGHGGAASCQGMGGNNLSKCQLEGFFFFLQSVKYECGRKVS